MVDLINYCPIIGEHTFIQFSYLRLNWLTGIADYLTYYDEETKSKYTIGEIKSILWD